MMHYALRCDDGHEFDGWFPDGAAFDRQCAEALVECPICGSMEVRRGLMAPAIGGRCRAGTVPAATRAMLQRLRAEVERHFDNVGTDFAAEARRIHDGVAEVRLIYGQATPEQAEALKEDGIEVTMLPWVDPAHA